VSTNHILQNFLSACGNFPEWKPTLDINRPSDVKLHILRLNMVLNSFGFGSEKSNSTSKKLHAQIARVVFKKDVLLKCILFPENISFIFAETITISR
jgi:hypothetical protein